MENEDIIEQTISFVKSNTSYNEPGHDWWHVHRVWEMSKHISKNYNVNNTIVELSALLHDVYDLKFADIKAEEEGFQKIYDLLKSFELGDVEIDAVMEIIKNLSFKNLNDKLPKSIEFKIVQDADRLDAMGAIGIARAFSYGGYKHREMYNPDIPPMDNFNKEQYINSKGPTINHFYEKLLKLKNLMNTPEALRIAGERHDFMLDFLEFFFKECNFNYQYPPVS